MNDCKQYELILNRTVWIWNLKFRQKYLISQNIHFSGISRRFFKIKAVNIHDDNYFITYIAPIPR